LIFQGRYKRRACSNDAWAAELFDSGLAWKATGVPGLQSGPVKQQLGGPERATRSGLRLGLTGDDPKFYATAPGSSSEGDKEASDSCNYRCRRSLYRGCYKGGWFLDGSANGVTFRPHSLKMRQKPATQATSMIAVVVVVLVTGPVSFAPWAHQLDGALE
jgi:hypothetical protein